MIIMSKAIQKKEPNLNELDDMIINLVMKMAKMYHLEREKEKRKK